jgi:hypothetical protein
MLFRAHEGGLGRLLADKRCLCTPGSQDKITRRAWGVHHEHRGIQGRLWRIDIRRSGVNGASGLDSVIGIEVATPQCEEVRTAVQEYRQLRQRAQ